MTIPNIIDPSVPIGKDDSCNVEIENSAIRSYRISKSHITQTSWSVSMVLILMRQEKLQETVSII